MKQAIQRWLGLNELAEQQQQIAALQKQLSALAEEVATHKKDTHDRLTVHDTRLERANLPVRYVQTPIGLQETR